MKAYTCVLLFLTSFDTIRGFERKPHFWRKLQLTTMAMYNFEGVDYDEHPDNLKDLHYDCYGRFNQCIIDVPYLHKICTINFHTDRPQHNFHLCHMDFLNCNYRIRHKMGVIPKHLNEGRFIYNGEGKETDCAIQNS